jgi:hypothetical protein
MDDLYDVDAYMFMYFMNVCDIYMLLMNIYIYIHGERREGCH